MLTHSVTLPLALAASLLASSASAHSNNGHHNQVRHHHAHAHANRAFVPVREALDARAVAVEGAKGRMQRKVRRAAQHGAVLLATDSNSTSSSSNSSSSSTAKYSSTAIWWKEAGWIGSCGVVINESDMVVALPLSVYPDVSTASPLCGSSVTVTSPSTGKSVTATVVGASDRQDYTTFSKAAYVALEGNLDQGELPIEFVADSSKVPAQTAQASANNAKIANVNVQDKTSSQAPSTTQPPMAAAAKTTQAPSPSSSAEESSGDWVCDSTETAESATVTSKAAAPTTAAAAAAAAAAASSKAAADAAWASSSSSKAAADAAWAASSSSSAASAAAASSKAAAAAAASSKAAADAAWASSSSAAAAAAASSKAAAAAAAAPAPTKVADTSSGSNLSLLSQAGVKGFLGTNTNAILSWYHTNSAQDSTNGHSWCSYPYDDSVPGVAPSLNTMLNNFGGDYQAAAKAYCGLEMVVTTPDGKSATLYIADAFDDTWVRTPSSLDVIYGSFAQLYGSQTSNKNDVVTGATWKFTGNRNPKYAFGSTTSLS